MKTNKNMTAFTISTSENRKLRIGSINPSSLPRCFERKTCKKDKAISKAINIDNNIMTLKVLSVVLSVIITLFPCLPVFSSQN
ncbi:MAG: hypothetical protein ACERKO_00560 [Acetanaerobacterium sp.]